MTLLSQRFLLFTWIGLLLCFHVAHSCSSCSHTAVNLNRVWYFLCCTGRVCWYWSWCGIQGIRPIREFMTFNFSMQVSPHRQLITLFAAKSNYVSAGSDIWANCFSRTKWCCGWSWSTIFQVHVYSPHTSQRMCEACSTPPLGNQALLAFLKATCYTTILSLFQQKHLIRISPFQLGKRRHFGRRKLCWGD